MSHGWRFSLAARLQIDELISRRSRGLKFGNTSISSSTVWRVAYAVVLVVIMSIVTPMGLSGTVT